MKETPSIEIDNGEYVELLEVEFVIMVNYTWH